MSSPSAVDKLKALMAAPPAAGSTQRILESQFSRDAEDLSESARQGKQKGSGGVVSPSASGVSLIEVWLNQDGLAEGVCGGRVGDTRFCCATDTCVVKAHEKNKFRFEDSDTACLFITSPTGSSPTAFTTQWVRVEDIGPEARATMLSTQRSVVDWQMFFTALRDPHSQSDQVMSAAIASAQFAMATPRAARRSPLKMEDSDSPSDWVDVASVTFPTGKVSDATLKSKVEQAVPILAEGVRQLQEAAQDQAKQVRLNKVAIDDELDGFDVRVTRLERLVGSRSDDVEASLWTMVGRQSATGIRDEERMMAMQKEIDSLKQAQSKFETQPFASNAAKQSIGEQVILLLQDGGVMETLNMCGEYVKEQLRVGPSPAAALASGMSISAQVSAAVNAATSKIMGDVRELLDAGIGSAAGGSALDELASLKARVEHCEEAGSSTQVVFDNITYASLLKTLEVVDALKIAAKHMTLLIDPFSLLQLAYASNADPTSVLGNVANAKKAGFASSFQATIIASLNLPLPLVYGGTEKEQSALGSHKHLLPGLTSWEAWNGTSQRIMSKRIRLTERISQTTKALNGHIRSSDMSGGAKRLAQEMLAKADSCLTQFFTFKLNFMSEMGENKESWELLAGMIHQMWTDFHKVRAEAALVNYEADEDERSNHVACYLWSMMQSHQIAQGYLEKDFRNHPSVSSVMTIHLIENRVSVVKFAEATQKLEKDCQFAVKTANEAKKLAERGQARGN
ncbi:hypothetical protein MPSEU_000552100 [Mayamaea pseudoterrestris]|nr:hypothetical protein MPSEU_000552100 [Mayamaea pseudoterrestris]